MGALTWTWDYFFVPQNQTTPVGTGFGTFSVIHLGVLALLAVGIAALVVTYRKSDGDQRRRIQLVVAWAVLLLEVFRQLAYILAGAYSPDILPLHLCAAATLAVFVDAIRPNRWTGDFLYALGWWGAMMAILFPDWASRPIFNIFTWQSFTIHSLILGYVLMRLVAGELAPDVRNLWRVAVLTAVAAALGFVANRTWGTNFWFLNAGSPGSPLEPIHAFAGDYYIHVLIIAVAIVWALLYLPWVLGGRARSASAARTE